MAMIELALIDLDDPAAAAKYLDESVAEPWKTYVPLAAQAPEKVAPKAAMELGDWYRTALLPKADNLPAADMRNRARLWYRAFLARAGDDADEQDIVAVRMALADLARADAKRRNRVDPRIVAFARKRARMPVREQVEITKKALAELNGPNLGIRVIVEDEQIIEISLSKCADLTNIEPLYGLPLRDLAIGFTQPWTRTGAEPVPKLHSLRGIHEAPLRSLGLSGLAMRDLSALVGMKDTLESLTIAGWPHLESLDELAALPVKSLTLSGLPKLSSLESLAGARVRALGLSGCPRLETLKTLRHLPLEEFTIKQCDGVFSLEGLPAARLRHLEIDWMRQIESIEPLKGAPLEVLKLSICNVKDLSALADVYLGSCNRLADISAILKAPLKTVSIDHCGSIPKDQLNALRKLPTLKKLDLE